MTRITKALIERMQENAIEKAGINKANASIGERDRALTEKFRIQSLGGQESYDKLMAVEKQLDKLIERVPKEFRETSYNPRITNRESRIRVNLAGLNLCRYIYDNDGNNVSMFARRDLTVLADDPLVAEFHAIEDDKKSLEEREHLIKVQVRAAASKVATVKRLLEIWPEAVELLPANIDDRTSNVPAILTDDLNKLIGLPTNTGE